MTLTPGKANNHSFKKNASSGVVSKQYFILIGILIVFGCISFVSVENFQHTSPGASNTVKEDSMLKSSKGESLSQSLKADLDLSHEAASKIEAIDETHDKHVELVEKLKSEKHTEAWLTGVSKRFHGKSSLEESESSAGGRGREVQKDIVGAGVSVPKKQQEKEPNHNFVRHSDRNANLRKVENILQEVKKEITSVSKGSSSSSSNSNSKLHTVTYATHGGRDDRFCRAVESSIRSGYDLVILGWGAKWIGLSQKLEAAQKYAKNLPDGHSILFTDAFDVLFCQSPEKVMEEYEKFNTDIIFSAECGCWPHVMEEGGRKCKSDKNGGYPVSPTPYRFLNSGTWIGKADTASEMLLAVMHEAGKDFANANDQKLVADFYMAGRFGIKLDFYNKLFQSMHMTLDPPLPYCNPADDVTVTPEGTFYNKRTKSLPGVLHFNGGGKRHHLGMEARAWYKGSKYNTADEKEKLRSHLITAPSDANPDRKLRFDELCRGYVK